MTKSVLLKSSGYFFPKKISFDPIFSIFICYFDEFSIPFLTLPPLMQYIIKLIDWSVYTRLLTVNNNVSQKSGSILVLDENQYFWILENRGELGFNHNSTWFSSMNLFFLLSFSSRYLPSLYLSSIQCYIIVSFCVQYMLFFFLSYVLVICPTNRS